MKTTGTFRLHFNRLSAAPLVWSVAYVGPDGEPLFEIAVPSFSVDGAQLTSRYRPKATPDDEDGKPGAWLEVVGELEVLADGSAVIRAVQDIPLTYPNGETITASTGRRWALGDRAWWLGSRLCPRGRAPHYPAEQDLAVTVAGIVTTGPDAGRATMIRTDDDAGIDMDPTVAPGLLVPRGFCHGCARSDAQLLLGGERCTSCTTLKVTR